MAYVEVSNERKMEKTAQLPVFCIACGSRLLCGVPYHDMAILVRKSKVIVPMTEALQREGIPFEADSAEHFFEGDYFRRFATTLEILKDIDKAKLYECWKDITEVDAFKIGYKFLRSCSSSGNMRLSKIIEGFCEKIIFINLF